MDFDAVESVNLDRMIGATRLDAALGRAKVDVAERLMTSAATAENFTPVKHETSVSDPVGLRSALDYDVIFSCVDRPWPRAVLNLIAYSDLVPVIDGGIALDTFDDGRLRGGSGAPTLWCRTALAWSASASLIWASSPWTDGACSTIPLISSGRAGRHPPVRMSPSFRRA